MTQQFTFNLMWTRTGALVIPPPRGSTGEVAKSAPAAVTGQPVLDLGGTALFAPSDVADAELKQVLHTFNP